MVVTASIGDWQIIIGGQEFADIVYFGDALSWLGRQVIVFATEDDQEVPVFVDMLRSLIVRDYQAPPGDPAEV